MDFNLVVSALLLSTRVASAIALVPVLGPSQIPAPVRVLLAITLGSSLAFGMEMGRTSIQSWTELQLGIAMLREASIGASFALGFAAAYGATQVAGRILDIQIGFGVAGVLNPATNTFAPLVGSVFGMVGIMLFLLMDGHHQLIRALALSVQIAPPGIAKTGFDVYAMLQQTSAMFTFGLMLAAPVLLALLMIDLTLAIYARSLPQLNVLVLSFGVKVVIGITLLSISLPWTQSVFERLYQNTFQLWSDLSLAQ